MPVGGRGQWPKARPPRCPRRVLCGYDPVGLRAGQRHAEERRAEEFSANLGEPLQCNTPERRISSKIVGEAI